MPTHPSGQATARKMDALFMEVGKRENRCKNEYLLGTATTQLELEPKNP